MVAFFVGSVRAPLTGIVLISEMTGGYDLLFPICIACMAAYLIAEGLRDRPIYDALLEADLERTGHGTIRTKPRTMYIGVQIGSAVENQQGCQRRPATGMSDHRHRTRRRDAVTNRPIGPAGGRSPLDPHSRRQAGSPAGNREFVYGAVAGQKEKGLGIENGLAKVS